MQLNRCFLATRSTNFLMQYLNLVWARYSIIMQKSNIHRNVCKKSIHNMRGSRQFWQWGSDFDNVFCCCFFSWGGEEGSKYHYKRDIIGPPAKRHLNGVSHACRCWPNIECWLGSFRIFQGIRTCIAKKPYIFVIFQGKGVRTPFPPLDPHMHKSLYHQSHILVSSEIMNTFLYKVNHEKYTAFPLENHLYVSVPFKKACEYDHQMPQSHATG